MDVYSNIYLCTHVYMCIYTFVHVYSHKHASQELHLIYICMLFWIVLELSGQWTKAQYESELGVAGGTAILCAELMSSNGNG